MLKGTHILVTGGTGFIGSHLCKALRKQGAVVWQAGSVHAKGSSVLPLNIEDYQALETIVRKHAITHIFHLAGESLVENGQHQPYATFKTNIIGTLNVVEVVRTVGLQRAIIASTSHVYGDQTTPSQEDHIPKASRPYETSKLCADTIAQSYANTFDLPIFIPRFVNVYGPGDTNFNRLIPSVMRAIVKGENPQIWGGSVEREYLYIDDAISACLSLAEVDINTTQGHRVFNFGSETLYTVKQVVQKIITISGQPLELVTTPATRSKEIERQGVSWERAETVLGWHPKTGLDAGLKKAYTWYAKLDTVHKESL